MSNLSNYQQQDNFETRLAGKVATGDTTITVQTNVSFTFSDPFYISVNPGLSNYEPMLVTGITGTTWTVTRAQARYTGDAGSAQTHSAGSKVIISDNQAAFQDIKTAVNTKLDQDGGNTTTTYDLAVSGSNFRHRLDGGDMKFTDDNQSEVTLSTLAAGGGADEKVKVSVNDTTAEYLDTKLVAGDGITLTENNDGGNETLTVAATADSLSFTAGEDLATNVPACQSPTADEIVNLFLEGPGSKVDFEADATTEITAAQVDTNKVVVCYTSGVAGNVVAGEIIGSSISWGSPATITGYSDRSCITKVDTNKFAVAFRDTGSELNVVVGTVSGTTVTIDNANTATVDATDVNAVSACQIDTDKILISYYDITNTQGEAAAVSISTTTPTSGTPVAFDTNTVAGTSCCPLDTDKALIIWRDSDAARGDSAVASIAGTVVTIGTPVEFYSTTQPAEVSCAQLDTDKAIVTYINNTSSIEATVCSVAATTPSYGTAAIVSNGVTVSIGAATANPTKCATLSSTLAMVGYSSTTESYYSLMDISATAVSGRGATATGEGDGDYFAVASAGDGQRAVICFDDDDDGSDGTSIVVAETGNEDAYVGITTSAITSGNTGSVQKEGKLTGFSGLTAGIAYYGESNNITSTPTELYVGVATDTDEMVLSHGDPTKMAYSDARFYRTQVSRAAATTTGNQFVALPFIPKIIVFEAKGDAGASGNASSSGSYVTDNGTSDEGCVYVDGAGVADSDTSNVVYSSDGAGNSQVAQVAGVVTGHGFTLGWTKAGTGNDTFVEITAYR